MTDVFTDPTRGTERPAPSLVTPSELMAVVAGVAPGADWATRLAGCAALDRLADRVPDTLRARVGLIGSSTLDPLAAFLRVEGARAGIWIDVWIGPYGQYFQELLRPDSALHAFRPHVTVVAVDAEVLWDMRWAGEDAGAQPARADELVAPLVAALDAATRHGSGIILVHDFAALRRSADGILGFRDPASFGHMVDDANAQLRAALEGRGSAYLFPFRDVLAQVGREHAINWRTHHRGHITWSDLMMAELARAYVAYAVGALGRSTKCLVLDLDNTLWGGVLGEDGPGGIAIGPAWPGREYLDLQRQLLALRRQGILLAVCSKNNEREALAVLREHPAMLIHDRDLAAFRINWEDKATNVRAIARELNLGLGHLLFLDDSPHERAWLRTELPELVVPEPPEDPARWGDWLPSLPTLAVLQRSAEDARRTEQYQEQRTRDEFHRQAGSMEGFLRGLRLRVAIEPVHDGTYSRVVQLLAKTNQFNLTTRRHDEATLRRRVGAGNWRVYTMHVADTFGDFGLTGVAIVAPDPDVWHLESLLLSCRVIGKSAETALLARIAEEARAAGAVSLTAEFIDSGRNEVAREFLPSHGFVSTGDGRFTRPLGDGGPRWPDWIARTGAPG